MKLYLTKRFYIDLEAGVICFKPGKSGEIVCEPVNLSVLDKAIEYVREFLEGVEEEEGYYPSDEEVEEELMEASEEVE